MVIVIMPQVFRVFGFVSVFSFLAACGGGGGSSNSSEPSVIVSGVVTYTSYQLNVVAGLDYGVSTEKPIRGAVVELQNARGTVLDSGNTSATGSYSLTAPVNTSVRVVVKAALGGQASPHTKIVDNTSSGAMYAMSMDVATGTSNLVQNFNANSGWDGVSYSATQLLGLPRRLPYWMWSTRQSKWY